MIENKTHTLPESFNEEVYAKQARLNSQLTSKNAEVLVFIIFLILMLSSILFIFKLLR